MPRSVASPKTTYAGTPCSRATPARQARSRSKSPLASLGRSPAAGRAFAVRGPRRDGVLPQLDRRRTAEHLCAGVAHDERPVPVAGHGDRAAGEQLPHDAAPLRLAEVGADAEGRQRLVPQPQHPRRRATEQDVDELPGAVPLPALSVEPDDRRQELLGDDRAVPGLGRIQTGVAVAAATRPRELLAEVPEQLPPAALRGLAEREHRVEVGGQVPSVRGRPLRLVDHAALLHDVLQTVEQQRVGWQPVAAGATGLLVVALHGLRQVEVCDEPHVGMSMPMPNAIVATITTPSRLRNSVWFRRRTRASSPA